MRNALVSAAVLSAFVLLGHSVAEARLPAHQSADRAADRAAQAATEEPVAVGTPLPTSTAPIPIDGAAEPLPNLISAWGGAGGGDCWMGSGASWDSPNAPFRFRDRLVLFPRSPSRLGIGLGGGVVANLGRGISLGFRR